MAIVASGQFADRSLSRAESTIPSASYIRSKHDRPRLSAGAFFLRRRARDFPVRSGRKPQ
jgi:hypothetical protein